MRWEVPTMRSGTSFFDKTLFRTDLRRYWPLLFVYTGIWTVMLPVVLWAATAMYGSAENVREYLYTAMHMGIYMALIFCPMLAMALFSYLMNSRPVSLMHALPVTRHTQFCSHVLSGLGMMAAGKLLVALLTLLVQLLRGSVVIGPLCLWFLVVTLVELFFFSLGILSCMITGWLLAAPVLYAAANCIASVVMVLLEMLAGMFYFGYASPMNMPAVVRWLTPVYALNNTLGKRVYENMDAESVAEQGSRILNPDAIPMLAIYTVVALVFLAVSWLLYRQRASESAGDPVAFSWAKPLFRCGISLLGGLTLGLGVYSILAMNRSEVSMPLLLVCILLLGVVSYFAAEMVICKSFRVFTHGWPGAVAMILVLAAVCFATKMDITGYQQRVPQAEKVETVEINLPYDNIYAEGCSGPELISAVVALHQIVVDDPMPAAAGEEVFTLHLTYQLEDGREMNRVFKLSAQRVREDPELYQALVTLLNCRELRYKDVLGNRYDPNKTYQMRGGYMFNEVEGGDQQITAEQAQALYEAVLEDLANGAGHRTPMEGSQEQCVIRIELDTGDVTLWPEITSDFTETISVLLSLGVERDQLFWDENGSTLLD